VALSNTPEQPSIRYYAYEGQGEVRSGAHWVSDGAHRRFRVAD
jgi:hypothetical protein